MIRCIAIDLDDTLLRSDLTISPEDKSAIRRAIKEGIKVLLASGRMVQSMRPYVRELGLDVPVIAYNGAIIQEAISGKILYHRPVPPEEARRLVPIFREAEIHLNAYINDELYMDELTEWGQKYAANAGVTPHPVGDLCRYLEEPSHKLLAVGEAERIDWIQERLRNEFGDRLQFVKSKPTYLEILAPEVSKGAALRELAAGWGLNRNEVMAIGDAPNDVSMVAWAGAGVAIGNGVPEVKEKAVLVVADHDHNGVAEALDKLVFKQ
ncbi:MAG: HAD family phosphatase [Firmicutes bacterium]|nr:HAD family phosphatase [Bacillota bacterium]